MKVVRKMEQESPNLLDLILDHHLDLIIDIPHRGAEHSKDGFLIRRNAIETGVHVITSLDTAAALAKSMKSAGKQNLSLVDIGTILR